MKPARKVMTNVVTEAAPWEHLEQSRSGLAAPGHWLTHTMGKLLHAWPVCDSTCGPGSGLGLERCPHGLGLVRTSPGRTPVGQRFSCKLEVEFCKKCDALQDSALMLVICHLPCKVVFTGPELST